MATNTSFDKTTTISEVTKAYPLSTSKTVLITGVSVGGIGYATAVGFAQAGASKVIITGRDNNRLAEAVKQLSAAHPKTEFQPLKLDLNSLAAVKDSANTLLNDASVPQIDILVANAGGGTFSNDRSESHDGLEYHFQVNHLAHYLFIRTVMPKIQAAAKNSETSGATRIIMVVSGAVYASPFRFSDPQFLKRLDDVPDAEKPNWDLMIKIFECEKREWFDFHMAYGQSKTAEALVALHLNTLYGAAGIRAFAVHPGVVQSAGATSMAEHMEEKMQQQLKTAKSIEQGAATSMVAALDPGLTAESGTYLADCQVATAPDWCLDKGTAERLWEMSGEILREKKVEV